MKSLFFLFFQIHFIQDSSLPPAFFRLPLPTPLISSAFLITSMLKAQTLQEKLTMDSNSLTLISCTLGGGLVGATATLLTLKHQLTERATAQLLVQEKLTWTQSQLEDLKQSLASHQAELLELRKKEAAWLTEQKHFQERIDAQAQFMESLKTQSKLEFENLAQSVLELKSKTFSEQTEKNLDGILRPLREKLGEFEKKVESTYRIEANERIALKTEIERLVLLNDRMTQETSQLTQALKGDSKFQGNWGELVLEKVLESSGLRENHEYTLQQEYRNDAGEKFRPDVIIHLPENKHLVVDAKVSLKSYEAYCNSQESAQRQASLEGHLKSVMKHVEELGSKHYSKLKGIKSPEFVFLFMPIEPAFLLAAQADPELTSKAWKQGVAIVTATSLLTSLKTVASIWKVENQNKNALEIAQEGAKLYDKFVGFLEDFEKIGKTFEQGHSQFTSAMGKLKEGPGNIFRKMELLRELGAAPNKKIKAELLE
ncbi:MAG: DNA recombination protein RmuC [Bdellovibrionia bacterium]